MILYEIFKILTSISVYVCIVKTLRSSFIAEHHCQLLKVSSRSTIILRVVCEEIFVSR